MRRIKKICIGVGAGLLLLVAVVVALPFIVDVNRFKGPILEQVESRINGKVTLERIGLKIFPFIGLRLEGLEVRNLPETPFADTPLLKLGEMDFRIHLKSLLERRVVASLLLQAPEIQYLKGTEGTNLDLILKKPSAEPPPETKPTEAPKAEAPKKEPLIQDVVVERISIREGLIVYEDRTTTPPKPLKIAGLRLEVTNAVLTDTARPIGIELGLRLFDAQEENVSFLSQVAVDQAAKKATVKDAKLTLAGSPILIQVTVDDYETKKNFNLRIDAPSFAMASVYSLVPDAKGKFPAGSSLDGSLGLSVAAQGVPEAIDYKGKIDLKAASIKYGDQFVKPAGSTMDLAVEGSSSPQSLTIRDLAFHLLSAAITGSGSLEQAGSKNLALDLKSTPINLKEMLGLSPANQALDVEGNLSLTLGARGPTDSLGISGTLRSEKFRYEKYTLTGLSGGFSYGGGEARLNELGFDLFEGRFLGSGVVDLKGAKPRWDFTFRVERANVNTALTTLASLPDVMTGTGNSDLAIQGTGTTAEEIKKTVSGTLKLDLQDGELKAFNLAPNIFTPDLIGRMSSGAEKVPGTQLTGYQVTAPGAVERLKGTPYHRLATSMTIQEGKILLSNMNLDHSGHFVQMEGSMDLDLKLDIAGKYFLSKPETETWITHARLRSYLTDPEGRFLVPFRIVGTLTEPKVGVDGDYVSDLMRKAVASLLEDEVKRRGKEVADAARKKAEEEAKQAKAKVEAEASAAADAAKKKAEEEAKQKAGEAAKKLKGAF